MGYAPLARAKRLGTDVLEAIAKRTGKTAAQVQQRERSALDILSPFCDAYVGHA